MESSITSSSKKNDNNKIFAFIEMFFCITPIKNYFLFTDIFTDNKTILFIATLIELKGHIDIQDVFNFHEANSNENTLQDLQNDFMLKIEDFKNYCNDNQITLNLDLFASLIRDIDVVPLIEYKKEFKIPTEPNNFFLYFNQIDSEILLKLTKMSTFNQLNLYKLKQRFIENNNPSIIIHKSPSLYNSDDLSSLIQTTSKVILYYEKSTPY